MLPNPDDPANRHEQPPARRGRVVSAVLAAGIAVAALLAFGLGIGDEPHFVDESAFIAQSYYADLLIDGRRDDLAWLTYPAIDLPPLPKYLIGGTYRLLGEPRPGPAVAAAWYEDTSRTFAGPRTLTLARLPMLVLGIIGVLAVFAIGRRAGGWPAGLAAALFLIANPLYRLHARRAMADVPAEAFILVTLALGLAAWSRILTGRLGAGTWGLVAASGIAAGLAVEAKLNGGLGLIILGAWAMLGLILPGFAIGRKLALLAAFGLSSALAFGTFLAGNPALTAHPAPPVPRELRELAAMPLSGRVGEIVRHRAGVSIEGQKLFPHNALTTATDKLRAVAVQGFGRFGPLGPRHSDSTKRYDLAQDWGALAWLPLVAIGGVVALARGRREIRVGTPPIAWAVGLAWLSAMIVVTWFIPLAWDRYFLSIQAGGALMAAFAVAAGFERLRGRVS